MNTASAAFSASVERLPDHPALMAEDGQSLTYRELDAARRHAACALLAQGIVHGDRVAIWAQNCPEWVVLGLALHSIGAVLVPINTRFRGAEAGYVLKKSQARLLFCAGDFLDQHYPTLLGDHRPASLEKIIVFQDAAPTDTAWETFLATGTSIAADVLSAAEADVTPNDVLDVMFTSGTTGEPKGVVSRHEQNLRVVRDWCERMEMSPDDRYLIANPFFHAFGYKVGWLGGLISGCTILPQAVFDAGSIIRRIETEHISVLPGPPTLFVSLLDEPAARAADLRSLRATITGAAAVAPALIDRIRDELGFDIVLTGYGLTETCGIVSLCDADDDAQTIVSTCGRPIDDVEVRIVGSDNQARPAGESGEVVVRGYNVMVGYLDDDEATAAAVDSDGWLHTGDIGNLDDRGYLKITDRLKDMYICGGFNCYPAEIEKLMAAYPGVAQTAVIGVPDRRLGEVGCAFVVPQRGQIIDGDELIQWCRQQMANYKAPRRVIMVDQLPMNASGKVMKFQLSPD